MRDVENITTRTARMSLSAGIHAEYHIAPREHASPSLVRSLTVLPQLQEVVLVAVSAQLGPVLGARSSTAVAAPRLAGVIKSREHCDHSTTTGSSSNSNLAGVTKAREQQRPCNPWKPQCSVAWLRGSSASRNLHLMKTDSVSPGVQSRIVFT